MMLSLQLLGVTMIASQRGKHMSNMDKAKELYKIHNGCRNAVVSALVFDEGMTWEGARTYFAIIKQDEQHKQQMRAAQRAYWTSPWVIGWAVVGVLMLVGMATR